MAYSIEHINSIKPQGSLLTATDFDRIEIQGVSKIKHVSCVCNCGKMITTRMTSLINGHTYSCGCQRKDQIKKGTTEKKKSVKHSEYHYNITAIYHGMIKRCYDPLVPSYKNYGAKGVEVCEEWRNSYQAFLTWCLSNGWKKGLHIDKDKNGTGKLYSPETCTFILPRQNLLARAITRRVLYHGAMTPVSEVADMVGIPYYAIWGNCAKKGIPVEDYVQKYKPKKRHG